MELLVFMSTLFYRYDFRLADEKQERLDTSEGFLRKPLESWIRMRRRKTEA